MNKRFQRLDIEYTSEIQEKIGNLCIWILQERDKQNKGGLEWHSHNSQLGRVSAILKEWELNIITTDRLFELNELYTKYRPKNGNNK